MNAATLTTPFSHLMAEPRIDGFLSGKAAAKVTGALVVVRNENTDAEEWLLRVPGREDVRLGHDFKRARMALQHLLDHLKAGGELPE
jgi:hypothetical protein